MSLRARLLSSSVVLALASCGGSPPTATPTCNLASLTVSGATSILVRGTTALTYAAVENAGSTCSSTELGSGVWTSLNPSVATVVGGVVTGVAPGTATISLDLLSRNDTHVVQVNATPTATVNPTPANPSVPVGLTQQMLVICLDSDGYTTACTPTWSAPSSGVATISASGLVTALTVGSLVVTATVGSVTGQTTVTVIAAPAAGPLAYALADQPSASGPYTPNSAYHFNALGGPMTVTRASTGTYQVVIPGFGGAPGSSRAALVSAVNDAAVVCKVTSSTLFTVGDGTVYVLCADHTGAATDSRFTVLAVGEGALPGNFAFGHVPVLPASPGGSTANLPLSDAWSSAGQPVRIIRDNINTQGRFLLDSRLPALVGSYYVPVLVPAGTETPRCTLSSWGTSLDVVCYPIGGGSMTDARFAGMFLDQPRGGMRLGAVWANQASAATYAAPATGFRNSSGGGAQITRSATGRYSVTFQNLGRTGSRIETAVVTTHELFTAASCRIRTPWSTALAADLTIEVTCHAGDGSARDQVFVLVVIE